MSVGKSGRITGIRRMAAKKTGFAAAPRKKSKQSRRSNRKTHPRSSGMGDGTSYALFERLSLVIRRSDHEKTRVQRLFEQ